MVNDVGRAFFHAKARRDVYVQIADDDEQAGDEHRCGKLNFSMYGTRDAVQIWANVCADMLVVSIGFAQGNASPCVCYHKGRQIRIFVHGGDYVSSAFPKQLEWLKGGMDKKYQIKTQWLGSGTQYQQDVKHLNRIVGWDDDVRGLVFEADPRHAEIIIEQVKFKEATLYQHPVQKMMGKRQVIVANVSTRIRHHNIEQSRPDVITSRSIYQISRIRQTNLRDTCFNQRRAIGHDREGWQDIYWVDQGCNTFTHGKTAKPY